MDDTFKKVGLAYCAKYPHLKTMFVKASAGHPAAIKGFIDNALDLAAPEGVGVKDLMEFGLIKRQRGGYRPNAGRKPNEVPTKAIRLPADVADWLKASADNIEQVRKLIHG